MNRSAYLTTGLAIKAFSRLSKADIQVHGKENIPDGPTIFVMNHFTRVETFLLPYVIYQITNKPVWSLAAAALFKGGLGKFFNLIGVVSTRDPDRDRLIVGSLLTGEANWIIFPEGSMIKTKKITAKGKYMIASSDGIHEPHTGAAALALQAELYRTLLLGREKTSQTLASMLEVLGLDDQHSVKPEATCILPVNLTYYPIRAAVNIASDFASRMVKDISERMVEEIMIEGTMMLSGVDIDVRFGKPISMADYLRPQWQNGSMMADGITGYSVEEPLRKDMRGVARKIMHQYMHDIYTMTTVNHEHLFASFLRWYPLKRIKQLEFLRLVVLAAAGIREEGVETKRFYLHRSLLGNQAHLLTDDRYEKFSNFIKLAEEKGVVRRYNGYLVCDRKKLSAPLSFHRGRIDNPIEVMANEVEPLTDLMKLIRRLVWLPPFWVRFKLIRFLFHREKAVYRKACSLYSSAEKKGQMCSGVPYLLPSYRLKTGLVLIHSYLAIPEEVRGLARSLRRRGIWVYAVRLPGHGTSPEDLSRRTFQEWVEAVENGYVLLSALCKNVVVGGVGFGGSLALDLASRVSQVAGVFAICPPLELKDYSTKFMPGRDVWNRLLGRLKGEGKHEFLEFEHGNRYVNYRRNPVAGIREVGEFLDSSRDGYSQIQQPTLIMQADGNPVVSPEGSKRLYDLVGSVQKEFCLLSSGQHVLIEGDGVGKVFRRIGNFLADLSSSNGDNQNKRGAQWLQKPEMEKVDSGMTT